MKQIDAWFQTSSSSYLKYDTSHQENIIEEKSIFSAQSRSK